jgi:hypothetical protein
MPKKFLRFKLLLDEGLPDLQVYKIAEVEKRVIVTFNDKDFNEFVKRGNNSGVIGVSQNMIDDEIDKKLVSFLSKARKGDLYGKFVSISITEGLDLCQMEFMKSTLWGIVHGEMIQK